MIYQRSLARTANLNKSRRKWLDKNVPGWMPEYDIREVQWNRQAQELAKFVESTGRLPRVSAPTETKLARWLGTQRAAARAGQLSRPRIETLNTVAAGWLPIRRGA